MNIHELSTYNLGDAVKFHNRLNPDLWDEQERLRPEVRAKLLEIAADFQEFLGVSDLQVKDITISGSNAAFTYTPHSDIDLHLVVDQPEQNDEVYQELFNAKKYQYNDIHDIRIRGADVELYVQPSDQPVVSLGEYSILNDKWLQVPRRKRAKIDHDIVRHKYEDLKARIENALRDDDSDRIDALAKKIKMMRKTGLDQHGEFGPENLAFKILRTQGYIKKLYDAAAAARDRELSLQERKKKKRRVRYGFGGYWFPGYGFGAGNDSADGGDGGGGESVREDNTDMAQGSEIGDAGAQSTWDGVSPDTQEFLNEEHSVETVLQDFIQDVAQRLRIEKMPQIELHQDPAWAEQNNSFGRYDPEAHTLHVSLANRHVLDIMRTTAHELAHCRQNELTELPDEAGETGSDWENEAHAVAGIFMRNFADAHPEYFKKPIVHESSGYIPTAAQANDPRFKMALTVDVRPGETGRQANKMSLQTDSQGRPALLMKTVNLVESLQKEFDLLEDQFLGEIRMSPSSLRAEAAKTGAIAGMEFEMIVPNVNNPEDEDSEPDWDMDESVRDIDDACNFFYDGDFNSRRDIANLREEMEGQYYDWLDERKLEKWGEEAADFVRDWLWGRYEDDWREQAEDAVLSNAPEFGANDQELRDQIEDMVRERHDEVTEETLRDMNSDYDEAYDEWSEDFNANTDMQREWLEDQGWTTMQDIHSNFDIQWPHWTTPSSGEQDIQTVANDFSDAVGMPVNASTSYHGGRREPDTYVVEPDGSLSPDDDDDAGLEFVSPPLPIDELLDQLKKVKEWAGRYGCYTNNSTGLHINISVPDYSLDKLDYVKLALLMGDEYVLDQFGRMSNTYAKSAMGKIRTILQQRPEAAEQVLEKMKGHMDGLATKAIHSGTTDKYTSINTKSGYIEFRSPGGDWLDENFDKVENTLLRFTVALSAALDPEAYRQEYLKKLYKLLAPKSEDDPISYFARYSAGQLPRSALRSFVKQVQLKRQMAKGTAELGKQYWWNVQWDANRRMEVVASNKAVALQVAAEEWGVPESQLAGAKVTVLRPYEPPQTPAARPQQSDPYRSVPIPGVTDVELDIPMAPRGGAAQPSSVGRELQGWSVIGPNGEEITQFRGIGNNQADANRIAADYLRQRGLANPAGYEVVPVWVDA